MWRPLPFRCGDSYGVLQNVEVKGGREHPKMAMVFVLLLYGKWQ